MENAAGIRIRTSSGAELNFLSLELNSGPFLLRVVCVAGDSVGRRASHLAAGWGSGSPRAAYDP